MSKTKLKDCNVDDQDLELEDTLMKNATLEAVNYLNHIFEGGNQKYEKIEQKLAIAEAEMKEKHEKEKLKIRLEKKISRSKRKHEEKVKRREERKKAGLAGVKNDVNDKSKFAIKKDYYKDFTENNDKSRSYRKGVKKMENRSRTESKNLKDFGTISNENISNKKIKENKKFEDKKNKNIGKKSSDDFKNKIRKSFDKNEKTERYKKGRKSSSKIHKERPQKNKSFSKGDKFEKKKSVFGNKRK